MNRQRSNKSLLWLFIRILECFRINHYFEWHTWFLMKNLKNLKKLKTLRIICFLLKNIWYKRWLRVNSIEIFFRRSNVIYNRKEKQKSDWDFHFCEIGPWILQILIFVWMILYEFPVKVLYFLKLMINSCGFLHFIVYFMRSYKFH
jgi:hypothetical protein